MRCFLWVQVDAYVLGFAVDWCYALLVICVMLDTWVVCDELLTWVVLLLYVDLVEYCLWSLLVRLCGLIVLRRLFTCLI